MPNASTRKQTLFAGFLGFLVAPLTAHSAPGEEKDSSTGFSVARLGALSVSMRVTSAGRPFTLGPPFTAISALQQVSVKGHDECPFELSCVIAGVVPVGAPIIM